MTTLKSYKFFDLPTVKLDIERPDPAAVKKAGSFGTATLHEAAGKIGALPSAIKPITRVKAGGMPTGLMTSRAAPLSDMLRTVHATSLFSKVIVPPLKTR